MKASIARDALFYPAFPYDHFTHATDQDVDRALCVPDEPAGRAQLCPLERPKIPVQHPSSCCRVENPLPQAGRPRTRRRPKSRWNRGRYLVRKELGHCGSCHTPRNLFGAEKKNSAYAGAVVEGWYGPSLNSSIFAAHKWRADQLAEYLSTGWHKMHGAAVQTMADVCAKNPSLKPRGKMFRRWPFTSRASRMTQKRQPRLRKINRW